MLAIAEITGAKLPTLVTSYDPDAPNEPDYEEPPEPIDPDQPPARSDFPPDSIVELDNRAGAGDGQIIQMVHRREGAEIVTQDAIKGDYWHFPSDFLRGQLGLRANRLIMIEVRGDSMEPTIGARDRVLVDTADQTLGDGLFAIRVPHLDDVQVKRIHIAGYSPLRISIVSDNPKHPPTPIEPADLAIVGKVVCGLRSF